MRPFTFHYGPKLIAGEGGVERGRAEEGSGSPALTVHELIRAFAT